MAYVSKGGGRFEGIRRRGVASESDKKFIESVRAFIDGEEDMAHVFDAAREWAHDDFAVRQKLTVWHRRREAEAAVGRALVGYIDTGLGPVPNTNELNETLSNLRALGTFNG
jgi:hypothetical protein